MNSSTLSEPLLSRSSFLNLQVGSEERCRTLTNGQSRSLLAPLAEALYLLGVEGGAHVEGERGLVPHGDGGLVERLGPAAPINRLPEPAQAAVRGKAHAPPDKARIELRTA